MTSFIRPVRPEDSEALTGLLRRSKAYWGYDDTFMNLFHEQLQITPDHITRAFAVYLVEADGRAQGFYYLKDDEGRCWLEDLFVEPDAMGRGYGKRLFEHAKQMAREAGYSEIQWESDPNAENFYLKMGAERIGEKYSLLIKGRVLPQMRIVLT